MSFKSAQNKVAGEELCELFGYTPFRLGIFVGIDLLHFPPIPRRDQTSRFLGRAISTVQEGQPRLKKRIFISTVAYASAARTHCEIPGERIRKEGTLPLCVK